MTTTKSSIRRTSFVSRGSINGIFPYNCIAVALAVSSICAILPVLDTGAAVLTGAQRIFSGISVFSLLAIPFFILAGNIMNKGGIAIRLINFAKLFTGNIPGALAHTNAVANMLFGAISGSGTAAASAMGSIIGPIEECKQRSIMKEETNYKQKNKRNYP